MRKLALAACVVAILAIPAAASARVALHGSEKVAVVFDSEIDGMPAGTRGPSNWVIYHCTSAWGSRLDGGGWFVWWYSGGNRRACLSVSSNGYSIMFTDRDGYAENDDGGDEPEVSTCAGIANAHYLGYPRPSAAVVRDLLGGVCRS